MCTWPKVSQPATLIRLEGTMTEAQGLVLVQIPKALLVLTRAEFIAGLKRGKAWRRREALVVRTRQAEEAGGADARGGIHVD